MSKRPIEQKKRRRIAKELRRSTLPAYIDLVQWLIDRGHAKTKKQARKLILDGKVKSDSHTLGTGMDTVPGPTALLDLAAGREPTMIEKRVVLPLVEAKLRDRITVL